MTDKTIRSVIGEWTANEVIYGSEATLIRRDTAWIVQIAGVDVQTHAPENVTISPRLGSTPRRITFGDGAHFVTSDNDGVDALMGKSASSWIPKLEKFGWHQIGLVIASIILILGVYRYALPVMVQGAVWATPQAVKTQIDKGTLSTFDRLFAKPSKLPDDSKQNIQKTFQGLVTASGDKDKPFNLEFRSLGALGPNAFALPGGTIIMSDELVEFAEDTEIVAGVLAHEIAHVEMEHGLQQLYRSLGLAALIAVIAGDMGPVLDSVVLEGNTLLSLSFSRESEAEADRRGVELLHATGRTAKPLMAFFLKLSKEIPSSGSADKKDNNWWSSHPSHGNRIEAMRALEKAATE